MTIKPRTIAYRKEDIPQTSPARSGPVISYRITDMSPEEQEKVYSYPPPTNSYGKEHKRPVAYNLERKVK